MAVTANITPIGFDNREVKAQDHGAAFCAALTDGTLAAVAPGDTTGTKNSKFTVYKGLYVFAGRIVSIASDTEVPHNTGDETGDFGNLTSNSYVCLYAKVNLGNAANLVQLCTKVSDVPNPTFTNHAINCVGSVGVETKDTYEVPLCSVKWTGTAFSTSESDRYRIGSSVPKRIEKQVLISSSAWGSDNTATILVSPLETDTGDYLHANGMYFGLSAFGQDPMVTFHPDYYDDWTQNGVRCIAKIGNYLKFKCDATPTSDLVAVVVF